MDAKTILRLVSEVVEQQAQEDHLKSEVEKSAVMLDAFAGLCAVAILTHCDIADMNPKVVYGLMIDHIEEAMAEMILEEAGE